MESPRWQRAIISVIHRPMDNSCDHLPSLSPGPQTLALGKCITSAIKLFTVNIVGDINASGYISHWKFIYFFLGENESRVSQSGSFRTSNISIAREKKGHVCANDACKLKECISKQVRFANLLESDRGAEFQQVTLQVCSGHVWKDWNTNQQKMTVQSQRTEGALHELLATG